MSVASVSADAQFLSSSIGPRRLGPLPGGFLLAAINPDLVFALNAAGFLAIAIALPSCARVRTAKPFNSRRLARSSTKVARYVCSSPPLRTVLARNGFFALFNASEGSRAGARKAWAAVYPDEHRVSGCQPVFVRLGATALFQQPHSSRWQHPASAHLPSCGLGGVCPVVLVLFAPNGGCMDFVGIRTMGGGTAQYQAMGERTGQRGDDHAFAESHGRGWYDLGAPRAHLRHAVHPGHVAALFAAYLALTAQRDGPFGDRRHLVLGRGC
jgi:hypothetical protein